ncbi:basic amino acid/polyamine antiporter [Cellulomonas composti]|uniref:Amino acid APC transporter n=1 Tax=Cellulomonas composti TaxID=266130 RepID=A0A511JA08_9CELL|nr:basic amino acid/polyamine antiporter [Cellulomonas composti]GEL94818.1 amino acid APC transporter [Cellulomonas composti]
MTVGTEPARTGTMSRWTLAALVVGSMVGAGVFSLPAQFARGTGALGAAVAWLVAGAGMLMVALTFLRLADRRPDLDAGVYSYAREGFGRYAGFLSATGYWLTAVVGNVAYWVLIMSTIGGWIPAFEGGSTPAAIALGSVGIWVYHWLLTRGVQSAAAVNRIVTVAKLVPLVVFVVIAATAFDPGVFVDNLRGESGSMLEQVRSAMVITVFVFIGIEGASVYSRYARRRHDVGWATVSGFLAVLALFASVTMVSYGILPQAQIAALPDPSVSGVLEHIVGSWGATLIGVGILISVLGAYLAWTLMSCEVLVTGARSGDMPAALARQNSRGAPVVAITVTNVLVQAFLLLVLGAPDAFSLAVALCSSLILVPYLLSALFSVRVAWHDRAARAAGARWVVVSVATVAYATFLAWAGGWQYLLATFVVYAPASVAHVYVRRHQDGIGRRERIALVVVVAVGVAAAAAIVAGDVVI